MRLSERWSMRYSGFTAWIKLITLYEIVVGMKLTLSHLIHYKSVTLQYPHEKRLEFWHLNLAVFNVATSNHPPKVC